MADDTDKKTTKIVVTSHQVLSDPDATSDSPTTGSDEPAGPTKVPPSVSRLKIEPLSKPEDLKPTNDEAATDEPEPSTDNAEADSDDTGDDKPKDVSADKQDVIDSKAAEHQANIEKVALAKTYYLPINQVVRRRSKHVAIGGTVLIVILGLAWADVALDAGLITIPGVKAPTHFFSK
jgi:hypothetical protein